MMQVTQVTIEKTTDETKPPHPRIPPEKIGLAFQGGCFLAGALSTGVVKALIDSQFFGSVTAFSGTSAGALVAAMCWKHKLSDRVDEIALAEDLKQQWLANAIGAVPNQQTGDFLKLLDRIWSLSPVYFYVWKENMLVPALHQLFERWVQQYVKPEECMQLLYERYLEKVVEDPRGDWRSNAREEFKKHNERPGLVVSTTEIHQGEIVVIDDQDLFEALLDAFDIAWRERGHVQEAIDASRQRAIEVGAEYMTKALMASGSLDEVNGLTEIKQIEGLGRTQPHRGYYLDGAWAENPPIKELIEYGVDEIWMVEVFPKLCAIKPDSHEAREDRKEELWQNALVEQQLYFMRKVNLWLQSGRLIDDQPRLNDLRCELEERLKGAQRAQLLEAFAKGVTHADSYTTDNEKIEEMTKTYRPVETRCISLPPDMQPLTAGARIVNSAPYLLEKMEVGYDNAMKFLSKLPYRRQHY